MLKIIKLTLALFVVIFFSTCRKDCCQDPTNPECENYDPCYGKREIKINFRVTKAFNGFPGPPPECPYESRDTLYNITNVRFEAPKNNLLNSTYFWQVGTDTNIRKGKAIEVGFQNWVAQGNWEKQIPVTLTIRTPYNGCMNINDTLVKVTRNIMLSQKIWGYGIFYGRWNNQNFDDTFKMVLYKDMYKFKGINLPIGGNKVVFIKTPFADSFITYYNINLNQPECEKRVVNSQVPIAEEGFVYAYLPELLNFPNIRYTFWVRKPGEAEKIYTFNGRLIAPAPEIQL